MKKITRVISATAATAALTVAGLALSGSAAMASDTAPVVAPYSSSQSSTSAALIDGPLVQGPLIDIGGILNFLQIGQFQ